jgi:hypothetical protein
MQSAEAERQKMIAEQNAVRAEQNAEVAEQLADSIRHYKDLYYTPIKDSN